MADGMLGCLIFKFSVTVTSNDLIGSFVLPHTLLMATPGCQCSTAPRLSVVAAAHAETAQCRWHRDSVCPWPKRCH